MNIQTTLQEKLGKEIAQASNEEIYDALLSMVQEKRNAQTAKRSCTTFPQNSLLENCFLTI